jgi:Flp pilus assembly protein TadG
MKRFKLVSKLLRDIEGSVLVQTTIVIPIFLSLVLGTVDATYMFFEWALANKAVYIGARTAIVSDPVAQGITTFTYTSTPGQYCFNQTTLLPDPTANCPFVLNWVNCTGTSSSGSCDHSFTFNNTVFTNYIFPRMQAVYPRLQRQNVTVSYQTNGLGFVGESATPGAMSGLPMNVKVSIYCMTHQFYFLSALMNWAFSTPTDAKGNPCSPAPPQGPSIPTFASILQSEDMDSSNN